MSDRDPLANIGYISINDQETRVIGDFVIDPNILLPIEIPSDSKIWSEDNISWEAIISAMLKVLSSKPEYEHAAYYRQFILAVKPAIKEEFTEAGIIKARNKDFDIAIEIFKALEGLFADCAQTKLNLALVYHDRARHYERIENRHLFEENTEHAFKTYKNAISVDPEYPAGHINFAHFYLDQKNFEKAKEHFNLFLRYSKDPKKNKEVKAITREIESWGKMDKLFREAFDSINMGREIEGIEKIKIFLDSFPKVWNAWFLLGWGCRRLSQYAEGKKAFRKALNLHKKHPDTLNELAICLMELGEFDESYLKLVEALTLDPDNTKVISNLGILFLKRGNKKEAKSYFKSVLAKDADDHIAQKYLERLENDE